MFYIDLTRRPFVTGLNKDSGSMQLLQQLVVFRHQQLGWSGSWPCQGFIGWQWSVFLRRILSSCCSITEASDSKSQLCWPPEQIVRVNRAEWWNFRPSMTEDILQQIRAEVSTLILIYCQSCFSMLSSWGVGVTVCTVQVMNVRRTGRLISPWFEVMDILLDWKRQERRRRNRRWCFQSTLFILCCVLHDVT